MKTIISFLLVFGFAASGTAENKYLEAMTKAIEKQKSASTIEAFFESANTFERISQMEKTEWLPLYYAAHCYIVVSFMEPDNAKKDAVLDKAQQFLDKAFQIAPKESELFSLQAFLYPSRITVDPMTRGMEYIGKMNQALDEAIRLNPDNPRSYYLRAITVLNMPEGFGGGAASAKPIFEVAKQKFDSFQPKTSISPDWGKEQNELEMSKF
jgi:tetratricopeptide (TPR) repeat protein